MNKRRSNLRTISKERYLEGLILTFTKNDRKNELNNESKLRLNNFDQEKYEKFLKRKGRKC